MLAIPAGPEAAVALLAGGTPRRIDLIGVRVGDRPELAVAGSVYAGLPSVAGEIANATRWLSGPAVYPVAALRALAGWQPGDVPARPGPAGPAEFPGYAVVVANIAYFGAGMMVAPPARIDDGELDIVTMRHGSRLAFLRVLLRIRGGTHVALPQVGLDRAAAVTLTMDRALPVAADGEVLPGPARCRPGTPLTVRALPGILQCAGPGRVMTVEGAGRAWVAALPAELDGQRAILTGLLDHCAADPRVSWLVIGCSLGRAAADRLSDLDLGAGVAAADFDAARAGLRRAVDSVGDLVESFEHQLPGVTGPHSRIFAQYADRGQVDLVVMADTVDAGAIPNVVVLHDPAGRVTVRDTARPVTPEQVREWAFLGWCALADLGKYLRRGSAWEALARLDEARAQLWKLQASAAGAAQPQYGLTSILDFARGTRPGGERPRRSPGWSRPGCWPRPGRWPGCSARPATRWRRTWRAALPAAMARYITADLAGLTAGETGPDMGAPARA